MSRCVTVERVRSLSPEAFRDDFLVPERPVILEGGAQRMPAFNLWTDDYLTRAFGDDLRPTVTLPDGRLARMRLTDFFRYLAAPDSFRSSIGLAYLTNLYLRPGWSMLADESACPLPLERDAKMIEFITLWAGPAGTGNAMHQDVYATHAWVAQLRGRKAWRLCEPQFLTLEDAIDPFADDETDFPIYAAVLEPGDVLYFPPSYWHETRNLTACLSVTGNFCPPAHAHAALHEALESGDRRSKLLSILLGDGGAYGLAQAG